MGIRTILAAGGLALSISGCGAASQPQAQVAGTRCAGLAGADSEVAALLASANVERVEPTYHTFNHLAGPVPLYVSGARIYVPAERGMNEAYVERALSCHAQSGVASQPNDPLRAEGVRDVEVRAAGQSFAIEVIGVDRAAGEGIWQRAKALGGHHTQVEIEQLAAADRSAL